MRLPSRPVERRTLASTFITAAICASLAVGLAVSASPARAEGNAVLPFWAQPFPYGYTRVRPRCAPTERARYTRTSRDDGAVICETVLHSRG